MNRNKALFGEISVDKSSKEESKSRRNVSATLRHRHSILGEVMSGKRETVVHHKIDPDRCRMWKLHDRFYNLLNENTCRDLIDGFKASGHQENPAVVRPCTDDSDYDYEVICGARRHWTAKYLKWDLLVEARELSDEEAFQLNDIDNRDRKDISDYERAQSYQRALKEIYKNQNQMAERLGISADHLNRLLGLATLPQPIVEAYTDIREIRVAHYRALAPLLKDESTQNAMLKRATQLKVQKLKPAKLVSELKKAATPSNKKANNQLDQYQAKRSNRTMLTVTRPKRGELVLRIPTDSGAREKELMEAINDALDKHLF